MGDKYISLFLWWDLRILIINCKIRNTQIMYTKCIQREVTISMAAKKTRKRKTSSAKKRTRTRQKRFCTVL